MPKVWTVTCGACLKARVTSLSLPTCPSVIRTTLVRRPAEQEPGAAEPPVRLGHPRRLLRRLDASGHGWAAHRCIEERQRVSTEPEHRHTERFEQLRRRRHVEEGLHAGGDDERGRARELGQVGRDVRRVREAAMHASDPAGREDADACRPSDGERAADRRRAGGVLHGGGRQVARPDLARFRPEVRELFRRQSEANLPAEAANGRGDGARRPHLPLDLDTLAGREAVRDESRLERNDGTACGERVAHLVGEADHAERSISTKRLSSPRRTSWKPARR